MYIFISNSKNHISYYFRSITKQAFLCNWHWMWKYKFFFWIFLLELIQILQACNHGSCLFQTWSTSNKFKNNSVRVFPWRCRRCFSEVIPSFPNVIHQILIWCQLIIWKTSFFSTRRHARAQISFYLFQFYSSS